MTNTKFYENNILKSAASGKQAVVIRNETKRAVLKLKLFNEYPETSINVWSIMIHTVKTNNL